jgi:hypothetical protein
VRDSRFSPQRGEDLRAPQHRVRGSKSGLRREKNPREPKEAPNQGKNEDLLIVSTKERNIQERDEPINERRTF